jgi:DNA gyrase/topoisomerase IV subunit A
MYDFTVDNYENLMVVTGGRDSSFTVVSAHNSATYGALVNLTWQRYPLLAGQGNFGDPLADLPPAAPRYTGVLASSLLPEMFRDQAVTLLEPNYTGEFQEPTFIPTRLPILLLNGSEGIAVGVSARIPPHNLKAVVATLKKELRDPKASLATLSKILGGPDYPEGGILLSSASDLLELHKTGKGSLIFQCAYDIECVKNGYHLIVESGCPHWNLATFVERCQTLVAENELGWVANESGETIKVVCYSRYRERLEEHIVPLLQRKVSYNWIALDANKNPISFNLKSYCQLFLESRRQIVRQYLDYRLANLKKQKEVEEAKLLVVRHLDEAITALRAPKPREYALPRFFKRYDSKPTEDSEQKYMRQTEVILKSSLNSLTRASEEKQRKELKRLKSEIKEVSDCIKDIDGVIYKELDSLKVYFDERRTSCPL